MDIIKTLQDASKERIRNVGELIATLSKELKSIVTLLPEDQQESVIDSLLSEIKSGVISEVPKKRGRRAGKKRKRIKKEEAVKRESNPKPRKKKRVKKKAGPAPVPEQGREETS